MWVRQELVEGFEDRFHTPCWIFGASSESTWLQYDEKEGVSVANDTRVMVISAHAADFCSRSGGTLIKYVRSGARVKVVWITQGETEESQYLYNQRPGITVEEVRKIREQEGFAAAKVIGAEGKAFSFGDHPLRMTTECIEQLAQEIADFDPSIILTHWHDERTHPSHHTTSLSVLKAARLVQQWKMDVRFFEPHLGAAARLGYVPDYYVNISDVFEQKVEAMCKLAAQPELAPGYTICNLWRGLECGGKRVGVEYAEGFVHYAPKPPVFDTLP